MNTELHTDSFIIACCLSNLLNKAGFETEFKRDSAQSICDMRYQVISSVSWKGMEQALEDAKKQFPLTATKHRYGIKHFATNEMVITL